MHPGIPIALVFIGCCSNVVFLELLVSEYPGSGNLVTFMQFMFIACEGFIFTVKFGTEKSSIPVSKYGVMVSMFFVVQVINNMSFDYNIPMTLHIIFRAGSLIASLTLGVLILKRKYPVSKYFSVGLITLGISVCTFASAQSSNVKNSEGKPATLFSWVVGVGMLCFSLFMTARMGIYQEQVYKKFGKHPKEALFYNHALPLPGFLLIGSDIWQHILLFNQSAPFTMPLIGLMIPKMWVYLAGNMITQYICIRAVFTLTTECSALTVTLVVTLRKFASLILSIIYFQNPFTFAHWIGAVFVFIGTFIFTEVIPLGQKPLAQKAQKKD